MGFEIKGRLSLTVDKNSIDISNLKALENFEVKKISISDNVAVSNIEAAVGKIQNALSKGVVLNAAMFEIAGKIDSTKIREQLAKDPIPVKISFDAVKDATTAKTVKELSKNVVVQNSKLFSDLLQGGIDRSTSSNPILLNNWRIGGLENIGKQIEAYFNNYQIRLGAPTGLSEGAFRSRQEEQFALQDKKQNIQSLRGQLKGYTGLTSDKISPDQKSRFYDKIEKNYDKFRETNKEIGGPATGKDLSSMIKEYVNASALANKGQNVGANIDVKKKIEEQLDKMVTAISVPSQGVAESLKKVDNELEAMKYAISLNIKKAAGIGGATASNENISQYLQTEGQPRYSNMKSSKKSSFEDLDVALGKNKKDYLQIEDIPESSFQIQIEEYRKEIEDGQNRLISLDEQITSQNEQIAQIENILKEGGKKTDLTKSGKYHKEIQPYLGDKKQSATERRTVSEQLEEQLTIKRSQRSTAFSQKQDIESSIPVLSGNIKNVQEEMAARKRFAESELEIRKNLDIVTKNRADKEQIINEYLQDAKVVTEENLAIFKKVLSEKAKEVETTSKNKELAEKEKQIQDAIAQRKAGLLTNEELMNKILSSNSNLREEAIKQLNQLISLGKRQAYEKAGGELKGKKIEDFSDTAGLNAINRPIINKWASGLASGNAQEMVKAYEQAMRALQENIISTKMSKQKEDLSSEMKNSIFYMFKRQALRFAGWTVMAGGAYKAREAIHNLIGTTIEFQKEMTNTTKVMNISAKEAEYMGNEVKRMGVKYATSIIDVAKAAQVYAQQGKSMADTLKLTEASLLLSNVSVLTQVQSTEALTAIMEQFGYSANRAMEIVDKLNQVSDEFAVTEKDIADAVNRSGEAADAAGVSFEKYLGYVTAMQQRTRLGGRQIGTSLKTIFAGFRGEKGISTMESVGISSFGATGELRNEDEIISELAAKWDTLSTAQKNNIAMAIAGKRMYSSFLALINGHKMAVDATSTAFNSNGSAMKEQGKIIETLDKKIQKMTATYQDLATTIAEGGLKKGLGVGFDIFSKIGEGLKAIPPEATNAVALSISAAIASKVGKYVAIEYAKSIPGATHEQIAIMKQMPFSATAGKWAKRKVSGYWNDLQYEKYNKNIYGKNGGLLHGRGTLKNQYEISSLNKIEGSGLAGLPSQYTVGLKKSPIKQRFGRAGGFAKSQFGSMAIAGAGIAATDYANNIYSQGKNEEDLRYDPTRTGLSAVSTGLSVGLPFMMISGPVGAAVAGFTALAVVLGTVIEAYNDYEKDLRKAQGERKKTQENIQNVNVVKDEIQNIANKPSSYDNVLNMKSSYEGLFDEKKYGKETSDYFKSRQTEFETRAQGGLPTQKIFDDYLKKQEDIRKIQNRQAAKQGDLSVFSAAGDNALSKDSGFLRKLLKQIGEDSRLATGLGYVGIKPLDFATRYALGGTKGERTVEAMKGYKGEEFGQILSTASDKFDLSSSSGKIAATDWASSVAKKQKENIEIFVASKIKEGTLTIEEGATIVGNAFSIIEENLKQFISNFPTPSSEFITGLKKAVEGLNLFDNIITSLSNRTKQMSETTNSIYQSYGRQRFNANTNEAIGAAGLSESKYKALAKTYNLDPTAMARLEGASKQKEFKSLGDAFTEKKIGNKDLGESNILTLRANEFGKKIISDFEKNIDLTAPSTTNAIVGSMLQKKMNDETFSSKELPWKDTETSPENFSNFINKINEDKTSPEENESFKEWANKAMTWLGGGGADFHNYSAKDIAGLIGQQQAFGNTGADQVANMGTGEAKKQQAWNDSIRDYITVQQKALEVENKLIETNNSMISGYSEMAGMAGSSRNRELEIRRLRGKQLGETSFETAQGLKNTFSSSAGTSNIAAQISSIDSRIAEYKSLIYNRQKDATTAGATDVEAETNDILSYQKQIFELEKQKGQISIQNLEEALKLEEARGAAIEEEMNKRNSGASSIYGMNPFELLKQRSSVTALTSLIGGVGQGQEITQGQRQAGWRLGLSDRQNAMSSIQSGAYRFMGLSQEQMRALEQFGKSQDYTDEGTRIRNLEKQSIEDRIKFQNELKTREDVLYKARSEVVELERDLYTILLKGSEATREKRSELAAKLAVATGKEKEDLQAQYNALTAEMQQGGVAIGMATISKESLESLSQTIQKSNEQIIKNMPRSLDIKIGGGEGEKALVAVLAKILAEQASEQDVKNLMARVKELEDAASASSSNR
jgi:TP901 family phage tail tape measure protein